MAKDAAQLLQEKGVAVELINARFIKPLDTGFISSLGRRFKKIVTVEDNVVAGGFGSGVLELLCGQKINADLLAIGVPDEFVEQGRVDLLFEFIDMDAESIVERILNRWPELGQHQALELRKIGRS